MYISNCCICNLAQKLSEIVIPFAEEDAVFPKLCASSEFDILVKKVYLSPVATVVLASSFCCIIKYLLHLLNHHLSWLHCFFKIIASAGETVIQPLGFTTHRRHRFAMCFQNAMLNAIISSGCPYIICKLQRHFYPQCLFRQLSENHYQLRLHLQLKHYHLIFLLIALLLLLLEPPRLIVVAVTFPSTSPVS